MKLLSIDVGMKNLAYCLLDIDISNNYVIDEWGIINLCKDKQQYCNCNKKSGKCTSKAKYFKNNIYYCKTHAKQNKSFKLPPNILKPKVLKKQKLIDLKKIAINMNLKIPIKIKKKECMKLIIDSYNDDYLQFYIPKTTTDYSMIEYGITLKTKLTNYFKNKTIDIILIENQIGPLALRMKTLQGMIMQHFIENGITNIKEISASNKLKEFLGNKKTKYDERKKESIKITCNIINDNNQKWLDFFNIHKKKDDLADCFLQGLWFINNI